MTETEAMQIIQKHLLMFDQRPCRMGVRCYNKNIKESEFHYGYGLNHIDAVQDWLQKSKWRK